MTAQMTWASCVCGCAPADHDAVVLRPICIERQGKRALFEGTLGGCRVCGCGLYVRESPPRRPPTLHTQPDDERTLVTGPVEAADA